MENELTKEQAEIAEKGRRIDFIQGKRKSLLKTLKFIEDRSPWKAKIKKLLAGFAFIYDYSSAQQGWKHEIHVDERMKELIREAVRTRFDELTEELQSVQ